MMQASEVQKRRANMAHVTATNNLEGVRVSAYMAGKLDDYLKGNLSSAQLVAAAKAKYGIRD
tara:strand:- start:2925 stop:3110 length:186 start_codon:yes stop_codon:yes gene_type:complete